MRTLLRGILHAANFERSGPLLGGKARATSLFLRQKHGRWSALGESGCLFCA